MLDKHIIRCGKDTDFFIYNVNPARRVQCTVKLGHTTYKFTTSFLYGAGFRNSLLGSRRDRSNCIVKSLPGIWN